MTDIRHLAWPFRFESQPDGSVTAATVEQGSPDDYAAQIAVIVSCRLGFRDELPEFGVTPLTFTLGDLQTGPLRSQVLRWMPPGIDLSAQEIVDAVDATLRTVRVAATQPR